MSKRIETWPLDELLQFAAPEEVASGVVETPAIHPVLIDEVKRTILRGYSRVVFAAEYGMQDVPVVPLGKVGARTMEMYLAADARLAQCKGWTEADLKAEWERLLEEDVL